MSSSKSSASIGLAQTSFYALPLIGMHVLFGPVVVLQGIYAKYFGLELAGIAAVVFVAKLFDAVSDPVVGYLSDRSMANIGTRKPLILIGALLMIVSGYLLYVPPEGVSLIYFAASYMTFYLAYTLIEIPHLAWGAELSSDAKNRSRIYTARSFTSYGGVLLFFVVPLLPFFETTEVTPQTLKWTAIAVGTLIVPMTWLCIKKVPDGHYVSNRKRESFSVVARSIIANKPLLVFVLAYFLFSVGTGMWFAMLFIFIDGYLVLGEQFTPFYILALIASVLGTFVWYRLCRWLSKKQAFVSGAVLVLISILGLGLLTPGGLAPQALLSLLILGFFGYAAVTVFSPALLADIIDYGTWKFGVDRAGTYFSVYLFMTKASSGVGGALGLALAGIYGFDPAATIHSAEGIWGLKLATSYTPSVLIVISLFFLARLSICAKRHDTIRRRLESRAARLAREAI